MCFNFYKLLRVRTINMPHIHTTFPIPRINELKISYCLISSPYLFRSYFLRSASIAVIAL